MSDASADGGFISVAADRDSVSMGDDVDSHATTILLPQVVTLGEAIALIALEFSLGSNTTWSVEVDGATVAVEARQIQDRLFLVDPETPFTGSNVHFRYHMQRDAHEVKAELSRAATLSSGPASVPSRSPERAAGPLTSGPAALG
ncbi:hypothetical protein [Glycomyces sp. NRRL B-16210]|uniref:hypothetical protein n=1 Tax=Glycomyces sp. NRRL B-16210 TaxID=1463821 RepID=UPI0004C203D5|nr:hypothetical protein [Glycomyces sp. NRRL B-16210]